MGSYTELVCNLRITKPTENFLQIIHYLVKKVNGLTFTLPKHEFFSCDRWKMLLIGGSCYFDTVAPSTLAYDYSDWKLSVCSNIKNYDSEIKHFLNWIASYCQDGFVGYFRYEENDHPTLIYLNEGKVVLKVVN